MNDDLALVDALLKGNEEAMQEVYSRYSKDVWVFLRHYVNDPRLCEEIRDDVFVDVWRSASKYRAQGSLKSWIFGIARHRALDAMAQGRELAPLAPDLAVPDGSDPERAVLRLEEMQQFSKALQALEEDHRTVLLMAFVGDLSYADIGRAVGCPENTVKTRVFYARKKLRELLPGKHHE